MTSESSSAMLNMNDADTEDTEALTVTDDVGDGIPLIMEHGYDIAVKVDAPMKQLSTLETFVTYRVRCVCARWPTPPYVRRRYNHFKSLHKRLVNSNPLLAPPPLPPLHSARQQLDRYSPSFVAVRTLALHAFLDRVAKHPILTYSEDFRIFLTTPDDELDRLFKSENSALNLWGLGNALSYGSGETKQANGARVKDPEFTSASDYLQSLQHKLTTLCTLTNKLHKGVASFTTEYMNMKRLCDSWSSQCGSGGGGAECKCAGAVSVGAGGTARAHTPRSVPTHAAILPLLAAHAHAHVAKIAQRDSLHAAYVSGGSSSDELHNRLEQASEALRSELSDWTPKTRAELKHLLLDLADSKVASHTQTLMSWEHALRLCSQTDVSQLFKTVSKTAVLNLSPSKNRSDATPTETERDLDDLEADSNDSVSRDAVTDFDNSEYVYDSALKIIDTSKNNVEKRTQDISEDNPADISEDNEGKILKNISLDNEAKIIRDIVEENGIQRLKDISEDNGSKGNDDFKSKKNRAKISEDEFVDNEGKIILDISEDIGVKRSKDSALHGNNDITRNGQDKCEDFENSLKGANLDFDSLDEARGSTNDDGGLEKSELNPGRYFEMSGDTSRVNEGAETATSTVIIDPLRGFSEVDLS